jgi:hypothetical protein
MGQERAENARPGYVYMYAYVYMQTSRLFV